ncbi:hypothetical protein EYF80_032346 [Liparis tanakae]|uniref:Uncharacterized protein n=1 Tax=Liparis tanakae TaxID=230148 RepID=A0A4Z2GV62_9TELE|nr:hypothetical protein EYF80_032346 [Liparis tanakae]
MSEAGGVDSAGDEAARNEVKDERSDVTMMNRGTVLSDRAGAPLRKRRMGRTPKTRKMPLRPGGRRRDTERQKGAAAVRTGPGVHKCNSRRVLQDLGPEVTVSGTGVRKGHQKHLCP